MPRNEARQCPRNHHGPATLALLCRRALHLARRDPSHGALRGNLTRAPGNDACLLTLLRAAAGPAQKRLPWPPPVADRRADAVPRG